LEEGSVIVATTGFVSHDAQLVWKETGAEILTLPAKGRGVDLSALIDSFVERGWMEVLCEGGAELATSLLREDLVDRIELHHGPLMIGRGGPEIGDLGLETMEEARRWSLARLERAGEDVITVYDRLRD
jgi:diaminohydroxyphosphoribosylaminopyrimidine deaminase/5-amino-6-(5-phosphoribosylamino)uracil reductase